jgi:hypothetical protein
VHVEAAKARQEDLESRLESERENLRPALEHAKTQGAMLSHALQAAELESCALIQLPTPETNPK